jgi:hypothetical protein
MLFIQSNSLPLTLSEGERLRLLDALATRGFTPLVRASRRRLFQTLAEGAEAAELERECARWQAAEGGAAYTPGELFCADDCVFFLLFGANAEEGVGAGVVYGADASEPLSGLERFCQHVREALAESAPSAELPRWQTRAGRSSHGLARFISIQPADFVRAAAVLRGGRELARASELMESEVVRAFLRRVQEMRREGYTPRRLLKEAGALAGVSVERMLEAGLLEREVRVSCRESGHALFDLPSPDSLAAITISRAKCSQCASPVADEVIEETINPTRLAVSLLEDGGWLGNRVYRLIRSLGVPDTDIASGPPSAHGESCLAVEVCGNSFLFVTRDGELTPAFSRRVAEQVEEAEATHLVVVVTGAAEGEGRLRLYEFAWRRARAGHDLGMTIVEGLDGARAPIERAFAGAAHRELSRTLFPLDAALGYSAGNFVLGWFKSVKAHGSRPRPANIPALPFVDLDQRAAS